jgi:hypothetical protein
MKMRSRRHAVRLNDSLPHWVSVWTTTNGSCDSELLGILETMSLQEIHDDVPSGMLQLLRPVLS